MRLKKFVVGLTSLYLMILSGCGAARPSSAPMVTVQQCPRVVPCQLTAAHPTSNGDLNLALEQAEADWAACAAQVDMTYNCQNQSNAKTN